MKYHVYFSAFSGGAVGLAITQVMAMTQIIQWGMRQSAEVTNQMMAVERVLEYIQLKPEPNLKDRGLCLKTKEKECIALPAPVPSTWPDKGGIQFKEVYMRYADDHEPILKGLNIVIYPGQQVRGLCRRKSVRNDRFSRKILQGNDKRIYWYRS